MTGTNGPVPGEELRLLIERVERLEEEKKGKADDIRDVYAEAKSRGFDTKSMRRIVRLRKLTAEQRREQEAIDDIYKAALGMLDGTPLGNWAIQKLKKDEPEPAEPAAGDAPAAPEDDLYAKALELVVTHRKASVSWLQRRLRIGYNNASNIIARMEREGVVGPANHIGKRDVLAPPPGEGPAPEGVDAPTFLDPAPEEPELTIDDARRLGSEAAAVGASVTSNPFPAFDERRAAWDEAWCAALGSDGMEIPDALKPTPKPKKGAAGEAPPADGAAGDPPDHEHGDDEEGDDAGAGDVE